jgi:hypothetical protein
VFVNVIVTSGRAAPDESVTCPEILPVEPCADIRAGNANMPIKTAMQQTAIPAALNTDFWELDGF